jgi:hypothetical protein
MTRAIPFTQAGLRRTLEAVRKAGLHVKAIQPDGTVIVDERSAEASAQTTESLEEDEDVVL